MSRKTCKCPLQLLWVERKRIVKFFMILALNLTNGMDDIGFEDPCALCTKKTPHKKKCNEVKSHDLRCQFTLPLSLLNIFYWERVVGEHIPLLCVCLQRMLSLQTTRRLWLDFSSFKKTWFFKRSKMKFTKNKIKMSLFE